MLYYGTQDKLKGMFIAGAKMVEVKSEDELLQVIKVADCFPHNASLW